MPDDKPKVPTPPTDISTIPVPEPVVIQKHDWRPPEPPLPAPPTPPPFRQPKGDIAS